MDSRLIDASVDAFWSVESTGAPYRVLPDGCMDVIFDLSSGRATVVGAMTEAIVVRSPPGRHIFGVRFRPGRASLFLDMVAADVRDARVPVDLVLGRSASALVDQVLGARTDLQRANAVAAFVSEPRSRIRANDARVDRATRMIETLRGCVSIASVAKAIGLGERQLERVFHERVGIRPKFFARVLRMQEARRMLERTPLSRAALATEAGYTDEAHLLRDFRALCGAAPSKLADHSIGVQISTRNPLLSRT